MRNGLNIRDLNGVEASTSQFPLIGYTVFWRLAGIRVGHPDLEQALQAAGFGQYLPDPPTPRVALRRALAEWIRAKQRIARDLQLQQNDEDHDENNGGSRRTLIRVINRAGNEHLVYALVAEDIDFCRLGLSYGTALRILLHKKTGEMIGRDEFLSPWYASCASSYGLVDESSRDQDPAQFDAKASRGASGASKYTSGRQAMRKR